MWAQKLRLSWWCFLSYPTSGMFSSMTLMTLVITLLLLSAINRFSAAKAANNIKDSILLKLYKPDLKTFNPTAFKFILYDIKDEGQSLYKKY